jgi:hypothetical protein
MHIWGLQFRNFWRDKRPSDYFERQCFRRGGLVPGNALGLILAEHPHVAVLLDQDNLKLRFGGKLNPIIAMRSLHELSLPLGRLRATLRKIFLLIFALRLPSGPYVGHDEDFTILSFARFRCAIRDLALVAIFSAATSAFLIVCSILSGAMPRRIRLSIIFFLRSDLAAFLICLASASISFGIFVIPLHYRVFIYGANLMALTP